MTKEEILAFFEWLEKEGMEVCGPVPGGILGTAVLRPLDERDRGNVADAFIAHLKLGDQYIARAALPSNMVSVSAEALYEVLTALNGPGHLIRELQVTRDKPPVLTGNPIDLLISQYNEYRKRENGNG